MLGKLEYLIGIFDLFLYAKNGRLNSLIVQIFLSVSQAATKCVYMCVCNLIEIEAKKRCLEGKVAREQANKKKHRKMFQNELHIVPGSFATLFHEHIVEHA